MQGHSAHAKDLTPGRSLLLHPPQENKSCRASLSIANHGSSRVFHVRPLPQNITRWLCVARTPPDTHLRKDTDSSLVFESTSVHRQHSCRRRKKSSCLIPQTATWQSRPLSSFLPMAAAPRIERPRLSCQEATATSPSTTFPTTIAKRSSSSNGQSRRFGMFFLKRATKDDRPMPIKIRTRHIRSSTSTISTTSSRSSLLTPGNSLTLLRPSLSLSGEA